MTFAGDKDDGRTGDRDNDRRGPLRLPLVWRGQHPPNGGQGKLIPETGTTNMAAIFMSVSLQGMYIGLLQQFIQNTLAMSVRARG